MRSDDTSFMGSITISLLQDEGKDITMVILEVDEFLKNSTLFCFNTFIKENK
jgi:hypothetical protein